jgi:hypothetical protein
MILETRNSSSRLSFFNLLHAFASYPRSIKICLVFAWRSIAFARHRRAFRDVVNEGLLKACRVKVSIPFAGVNLGYTGSGRCVTCLFREDRVCISWVPAINLQLLKMCISFYTYQHLTISAARVCLRCGKRLICCKSEDNLSISLVTSSSLAV